MIVKMIPNIRNRMEAEIKENGGPDQEDTTNF